MLASCPRDPTGLHTVCVQMPALIHAHTHQCLLWSAHLFYACSAGHQQGPQHPGVTGQPYTTIPWEVMLQLTKITCLELSEGLTVQHLLQLTALTALQDISLAGTVNGLTAEQQWQLPAQLTKVCLNGFNKPISAASHPLALLTGLQHLCVSRCAIEAQALSHLVQLHTLQLQDVQLPALDHLYASPWLYSIGVGNQAQQAAAQAAADAALTALLFWLGQLQQLSTLEVQISSRYGIGMFVCSPPATAYSALTGSSSCG